MVLLRRDTPLEAVPSQELFMMCDIRPGGWPATFVREHVLFPSLYHTFAGAWASTNQAMTGCQFMVPDNTRFTLQLELREPDPAPAPAVARAEVWLFRNQGRPRRLSEHAWPLSTENSSIRKIGREFDIDLSRWKGEVVYLMLRTLVEGEIPRSPFDPFGLTVMWNDARLHSADYADEVNGARNTETVAEADKAAGNTASVAGDTSH